MIVNRVEISNFRSHKKTDLKFSEGISVIVGDNGSGKTSILESINFALFRQKPSANIDDLIRRGSDGAEVSVTFSSGGRTFRATRGRKVGRAYGSALYRVDGGRTLIVKGEEEITKEIENILGVGGELFTSAIYIKQGEIDGLVSAQPAVRKEHVGKLLGAEELERAFQGMGELVKEYRVRSEKLSSLPGDISEMEHVVEEKERAARVLGENLKKASENSASIEKGLKKLQAALKELEHLRNLQIERNEKEIRLKNILESITKIEEYEEELKESRAFYERYSSIEKEIKSLGGKKRELYELQERALGLKRELSNSEKRALELVDSITGHFDEYGGILGRKFANLEKLSEYRKKAIKKLEARIESSGKKSDALSSKINGAAGKNEAIEKATAELKKAAANCPVCKGPLDSKHKKELLTGYSRERQKNKADIEKWESALEKLKHEEGGARESLEDLKGINLELLNSYIKEHAKLKDSAQKLKADLKRNESALKGLSRVEKIIADKENEKSNLTKGSERYIAAKNYLRRNLPEKGDLEGARVKIEKRNSELEKSIKKLGGPLDVGKFEKMKVEEEMLQEKISEARSEEVRLKSRMEYENESLNGLKKRISELELQEKERKKLSRFLALLEDIRRLFHKDALQKELRTKARPLIEGYTKEIFDMFELPYTDLELTDDFNVALFNQDGRESIDMLSGGEKIACALALRLGIAKALSGSAMEMIILDEPTIHLDSQRRQELVEIIKKLSSIPQTIVVTHDKEFEQAADRLILVEKVRGISRASS